jgi:hypothetical protein
MRVEYIAFAAVSSALAGMKWELKDVLKVAQVPKLTGILESTVFSLHMNRCGKPLLPFGILWPNGQLGCPL